MGASRSFFASACFSSALAALACSKPLDPGLLEPARQTVSASASVGVPAPIAPAAAPDPYLTAEPTSAKSIGHTSYVLKLTLEGGAQAVFKPRSKLPLGDHRYKGEIAAYRLAAALGLDNVPRAIARTVDASRLRALRPDFDERGLVDDDGRVRGALMPWIDQYRVLPLEEPKQRARWEPWLFDAHAVIPDDQRPVAASIATMIAFDYLTANWDRWSGANVAQDGATGKVLFVDNDGAFYEWPAPATLARQRTQLERVTRFSRRFVTALRALEPDKLRAVLGEEAPGVALVSERVVQGVASRRAALLQIIECRIADAGESSALGFD